MLTVQYEIAVKLFSTLNEDEKMAFYAELEKLPKPVANSKPKTKQELIKERANEILAELEIEHCFKSIPAQGKLA